VNFFHVADGVRLASLLRWTSKNEIAICAGGSVAQRLPDWDYYPNGLFE
jgi:hypothetical protein